MGKLAEELGWHPVDAGPLSSALHLEHMTLLWIKMVRLEGRGPNFVWAMLERQLRFQREVLDLMDLGAKDFVPAG